MDESLSDISRISIDTLTDWHRIKANFAKAVFEQFDQRVRQSGLESERSSLMPHVQQFIDATFEKMKPNIRINGKRFEELKDDDDGREIEPFDEALDRETWSLYNQRLQWDVELATKRRTRPREIVNLLDNLFKAQEAASEELDELVDENEERIDNTMPDDATLAEASDTFSQTVQTQHERIKRLHEVEREVKGLKA
ncbi:hypothetical protein BC834DRAFT_973866 [Gloeopeniophorella convolvens]|nr:hypothetical protein BC834DRAFT_973866 [Gloeopeniophorella convolvens]